MIDYTIDQLESHLWESANILRGPVDAADFKTYIFPLLFFKRISDVHDEEFEGAKAEAGGDVDFARFPENHRIQILIVDASKEFREGRNQNTLEPQCAAP